MIRTRPAPHLPVSVQLDSTDDRALLALAGLLTAVHGTLSDLPLPRGGGPPPGAAGGE
jgi:hypothetical protein